MGKIFKIRDYQQEAVDSVFNQWVKFDNTILALIVGAGKTACAGFVCKKYFDSISYNASGHAPKILIIQHTEELIKQNMNTITTICGKLGTIVKAQKNDFSAQLVFASRQTLARENRRQDMPKFDVVIIDECHILGYEEIVEELKQKNPNLRILGLSATPFFPKGSNIFNNVAYTLSVPDMVKRGVLVPPVCKVIDLGVTKELNAISVVADDFNMAQAEKIMNKEVLNSAIVNSWLVEAGSRKTIAFCCTVTDAEGLNEAFLNAGIKSEVFHGGLHKKERVEMIHNFTYGDTQVLCSVMALTAGFDSPPCSCVIIKRPFFYKSTYIQAVGRGLRRCDPQEFPDIYKTDCIVLEYAGASLRHGNLMAEFNLEGDSKSNGLARMKNCPVCEAELYASTRQCPFCGYEYRFDEKEKEGVADFTMTEFDLLSASQFKWVNVTAQQNCMMANSFEAWAILVYYQNRWHAVGNNKAGRMHYLTAGTKTVCLKAADDFMYATCRNAKGKKNASWTELMPTDLQQMALRAKGYELTEISTGDWIYDYKLGKYGYKKIMITKDGLEVSRYTAQLILTMENSRQQIVKLIKEYAG